MARVKGGAGAPFFVASFVIDTYPVRDPTTESKSRLKEEDDQRTSVSTGRSDRRGSRAR